MWVDFAFLKDTAAKKKKKRKKEKKRIDLLTFHLPAYFQNWDLSGLYRIFSPMYIWV
jgi:hypothetical protein